MEVFFDIHDPTTLNRQGNDIGEQYRSIILYTDSKQKIATKKMIKKLEAGGKFDKKIITEVKKLDKFYPAENYHQNYFLNNPNALYCNLVISPKIKKFEKKHG